MTLPTISVERADVVEDDNGSGGTVITFRVNLSQASADEVSVGYRFPLGTAIESDFSYYANLSAAKLVIAAGSTSGLITLNTSGDAIDEVDESFFLELFNPANAVLAGGETTLRAVGVIQDDDGSGSNLSLFVNDALVTEGGSGTRLATFEVNLSQAYSSDLSFAYKTVDGSAKAGSDYIAQAGAVTFAAGQTQATVEVQVNGDETIESGEQFSLVLTPSPEIKNGTLGATGTATIVNDDINLSPVLAQAIADQSVAEDAAWTFQLSGSAFTDPNGDGLAYAATLADGGVLPSWISFDAVTHSFSGTPPKNFNGTIALKVSASDGEFSATDTFDLAVTPINDTPAIISNGGKPKASVTLAEKLKGVTTVKASDVDGGTELAYAIVGGADAQKFKIDSRTGALSFKAATDFEKPGDKNKDNKYDVTVTTSDGQAVDTQAITVAVKNAKGVTARGTDKADAADASHSMGGHRPTGEEDTLKGYDGDDKLSGLGGNDRLYGGEGRDKLNGGDGEDAFIFDTKLDAKKNADVIVDFRHADDVLWLDRNVFAGLTKGKPSDDAFHVGTKSADNEDRILYDKVHGDLYFDRDGSKGQYDAVKFAEASDNTKLDHTDFLII